MIHSIIDLLFPRRCPVCNRRLTNWSEVVCVHCLSTLPRTFYHRWRGNPLEQRFYGLLPVERAAAYFFYSPESPVHRIIHELKYHGHTRMGVEMGRCMATHFSVGEPSFFEGIDRILPVPLAARRMKQRGYNQSALLARGLSEVTGIPVSDGWVVRTVNNPTQTHLRDSMQRWENVWGIFSVNPLCADDFKGKHILLVDDVSTTGATISACALAIKEAVPSCRISIAVLGLTGGG